MIAGPGRLAFWWKNTGPYSSNFLTLYVNGQVFFCTSADWEERFISLPSGQNIIRWESLRTFSSAVQLLDQVRMIREPRVTVLESAVVSGSFQARFNLEGTRPLGIWMSTNLSAGGWSLLTNYVESVNPLLFTDPTAGQDRQRFYRFSWSDGTAASPLVTAATFPPQGPKRALCFCRSSGRESALTFFR